MRKLSDILDDARANRAHIDNLRAALHDAEKHQTELESEAEKALKAELSAIRPSDKPRNTRKRNGPADPVDYDAQELIKRNRKEPDETAHFRSES